MWPCAEAPKGPGKEHIQDRAAAPTNLGDRSRGQAGNVIRTGAAAYELGCGPAHASFATRDTYPELGLPVTLTPASIAIAAALGIVAVALAPLFGVRRLRNMDLPATLRVVE